MAIKERVCNQCGREWKGSIECPSCYAEDSSEIEEATNPLDRHCFRVNRKINGLWEVEFIGPPARIRTKTGAESLCRKLNQILKDAVA